MNQDIFNRIVDPGRCFLIAEIGSNHNGEFDVARRLMDIASEADADAVKFQSFLADQLVTPDHDDYELLKKIELPYDWYLKLKEEADQRGLIFFSTATNSTTLQWLEEVNVELYKIASPNITHLPLIMETSATGKPVIISTGMADLSTIDEAVNTFLMTGNTSLALLHCITEYPAIEKHINLRFIPALQSLYSHPVGYSDHTMGIAIAVGAVTLGAKIIEKHVTLDRNMQGPDHHYALEPKEFIDMVVSIRDVEKALGQSNKVVSNAEREKSNAYWRSIHAANNLQKGKSLNIDDMIIVRPNDGLHPRHLEDLVGLRLTRSVKLGEPLTWDVFREVDD